MILKLFFSGAEVPHIVTRYHNLTRNQTRQPQLSSTWDLTSSLSYLIHSHTGYLSHWLVSPPWGNEASLSSIWIQLWKDMLSSYQPRLSGKVVINSRPLKNAPPPPPFELPPSTPSFESLTQLPSPPTSPLDMNSAINSPPDLSLESLDDEEEEAMEVESRDENEAETLLFNE